jgi:adenosylhomocysteinase
MEDLQAAGLGRFFRRIAGRYPPAAGTASLLITHLVDDRPVFIAATAEATDLRAVLPKPRSIQPDVLVQAEKIAVCDPLSRELFAEPDTALAYLEQRAAGTDLVLADVGGYFAPALAGLCARFSGRIAAVIEDTENGLQRYLGLDKVPCPVFSVARSPLKVPEDFLVGQSVVFSVESLIRGHGDILACRPAAVIGFGKIGASTAALLHAKGLPVTIFDADPVKQTKALAQGYAVTRKRAEAIAGRASWCARLATSRCGRGLRRAA